MTWTRTDGNTRASVVELPPGYPLKVSARTQAGRLPFFPSIYSLSPGILNLILYFYCQYCLYANYSIWKKYKTKRTSRIDQGLENSLQDS